MGEQGLKAILTDGLCVPAWSLRIAQYGDCKASFATEWAACGNGASTAQRQQQLYQSMQASLIRITADMVVFCLRADPNDLGLTKKRRRQ